MSSLDRAAREFVESVFPADAAIQEQAVARVIDTAGRIDRRALATHLTPITMDWSPGSSQRIRCPRAAQAVLLAAHAVTAPSTGACIVTLTLASAVMGESTIGTVEIPSGQNIGEATIGYAVPAGAWLRASVTTANGAGTVSASLTLRVE